MILKIIILNIMINYSVNKLLFGEFGEFGGEKWEIIIYDGLINLYCNLVNLLFLIV